MNCSQCRIKNFAIREVTALPCYATPFFFTVDKHTVAYAAMCSGVMS